MPVIRVGFIYPLDSSWLGGISYYRNLWSAIAKLPEHEISPVIFMGTDHELNDITNIEIVRSKIFNRKSIYWFIWMISQRFFQKDFVLERLLLKNKIDVLSHYNLLGKSEKIKTIGWIPDFQHMHLPHLFNKKELKRRNKEFSKVSETCTKVIVSSRNALADLIAFSASGGKKAEVLQFAIAPHIEEPAKAISISELEEKYKFRGKYFLLPNQFWVHKNHGTVIEAVAKLKSSGIDVQVLATGNTNDPRCPQHFSTLMHQVNVTGIKDNFKVLGIIPIKDLNTLMQNAVAIINPSLFEGWSTTVEEAKSFNKRIILSDIPVHREQEPRRGEYFPPQNANILAEKMRNIWCDKSEVASKENELESSHNSPENNEKFFAFAKQYQEIIVGRKDIKE